MDFLVDEVQAALCRESHELRRVDSFLEYSTDFNSALAQMFANYGFNSGPSPVQFPAPLMFLEYTFASVDDKDADNATWHTLREVLYLNAAYLYIKDNVSFKFGGVFLFYLVLR